LKERKGKKMGKEEERGVSRIVITPFWHVCLTDNRRSVRPI